MSIWKNVMKTSALMLISDINVSYCSSVEIKSHPDKAIKLIKNKVFILSLKLTHLRSHQQSMTGKIKVFPLQIDAAQPRSSGEE